MFLPDFDRFYLPLKQVNEACSAPQKNPSKKDEF